MGQCSSSRTVVTPVEVAQTAPPEKVYIRFIKFVNTPWTSNTTLQASEEESASIVCASVTDAIHTLRSRQAREMQYASIYNTKSHISYVFTKLALSPQDVGTLALLPYLSYVDIAVQDCKHATRLLLCRPAIKVLLLNGVVYSTASAATRCA
jgi:hypothetical protein